MNIYTPITPTRLYQKKCSHCELKYYGKHTGQDIESYQGSGEYWQSHLKKHNATVIHICNSDWFYDTSIVEVAIKFSNDNNIVESDNWANMKPENGLDGGFQEVTKKRLELMKDPDWRINIGIPSKEKEKITKIKNGTLGKNNTEKMVATRKSNGSYDRNNTPEAIEKSNATKASKKGQPGYYKQSPEARASRTGKKRGPYKQRTI
jgi:hypothetical protein